MANIKPHLALLFGNAIWAVNYPLYHMIMPKYTSPAPLLTASLLFAAILTYIPLLWQKTEKVEKRDYIYLVAAAILSGLLRKGLVIFGLSMTSPVDGSIIASLIPITALIISIIAGVDRFTKERGVGLLLGLGGVVAIILIGNSPTHEKSDMMGNMLMLTYTVAAALYMVWLQPLFKKYNSITILRWVYTISSIIMLPWGFEGMISTPFKSMDTHTALILAFVVMAPTFIPNYLLNYALRYVKPTVSSIYSYVQPLLAIGISVWLGIDKLNWDTIICAIVIISGVTIVIRSYRDEGAIEAREHK